MLDLYSATIDVFAPYLGQTFRLHLEEGDLLLTLAEAGLLTKRQRPNSARFAPRESFSLVWRGPESPFLAQGMYNLSHPNPEIEGIEGLFLTAIGKDGAEILYQSIFN